MKNMFLMTFASLAFATVSASAAELSCSTRTTPNSYAPAFRMTAEISDAYLAGQELTSLEDVVVTVAGKTTEVGHIDADTDYRPRTNKNRARFSGLDFLADDDDFSGVVHGLLLPKVLTKDEITGGDEAMTLFNGSVLSSTDSYHDGIIDYFMMSCVILN